MIHSSMYFDAFIFDSKSLFKVTDVASVIALVFSFFTSATFFLIAESIRRNLFSISFSFETLSFSSFKKTASNSSFFTRSFSLFTLVCFLNSSSFFFLRNSFSFSSLLFLSFSIRIFSFDAKASLSICSFNRSFSDADKGLLIFIIDVSFFFVLLLGGGGTVVFFVAFVFADFVRFEEDETFFIIIVSPREV